MDQVWENLYAAGHNQRYPWDCVVSFIYRHAPRDTPRDETRILEIGFGTGSNLWFAAREGFNVSGTDGSDSAVNAAKQRFDSEGLSGDLRCQAFPEIPFEDNQFHLAVDRAATTCVSREICRETIRSIHRALRPSGLFFMNTYSHRHTSASAGQLMDDGRRVNIDSGTLTGVGGICFYNELELMEVLGSGWNVMNLDHVMVEDRTSNGSIHAEWRAVLQKNDSAANDD